MLRPLLRALSPFHSQPLQMRARNRRLTGRAKHRRQPRRRLRAQKLGPSTTVFRRILNDLQSRYLTRHRSTMPGSNSERMTEGGSCMSATIAIKFLILWHPSVPWRMAWAHRPTAEGNPKRQGAISLINFQLTKEITLVRRLDRRRDLIARRRSTPAGRSGSGRSPPAALTPAKLPFTIGDNGPIGGRRLRLAGERGGECRALLGFHQACRLPQHQAAMRAIHAGYRLRNIDLNIASRGGSC